MTRAAVPHLLSAALLIALAIVAAATAGDYGVAAEEPSQNRYGHRVVRWYASLGEDDAAATQNESRYTGGLFELVAQAAQRVSPLGTWPTRHLVNACFGLLGVVAAWWIGLQLAGPAGGLLSAVVLATTPVFWGSAFNDPRQLPFASLFALASAALVHTGLDRLPGPGWRVLVRLMSTGAAIGLAAAVHVSALMLVGLAALAWLVCVFEGRAGRSFPSRPLWRDLGRVGLDVAILVSTAWLLMVLFWPFAQLDPVQNPLAALQALVETRGDDLVLFGGRLQPASELPRGAAVWLLLLTLPETYFVAALLGGWRVVTVLRHTPLPADTWAKLRHLGWLLSACVLPLLWTVVAGTTPRDGGRSLLFVVPGLAALAGASTAWWLRGPQPVLVRAAAAALMAAVAAVTVADMVRLHPFQAVYYNRLLGGGLARAAPLYGADDRDAAAKQGVAWVLRNYAPAAGGRVRVAGSAGRASLALYLGQSDAGRRGFEAVSMEGSPHLVLASTARRDHERANGRVVHAVERAGWPLLQVLEVRDPR